MQRFIGTLAFLAFLLMPVTAQALTVDESHHALNAEFDYLVDPGGELTIDDLLRTASRHRFTPSANSKPDANFRPLWLKLDLDFSSRTPGKRYFLYSRLDNLYDIRLYRPDGHGGYSEWVTGQNHPASTRELDTLRYGFVIQSSEQPLTVYLRIVGGPGNNALPWDLVEEQHYLEESELYYRLGLACLAAIGTLLCFNLIIALSLRRADYLYYSAYVFSVMMALITLDGIGAYYFWPNTPALNERAMHCFNLLSAAMRLLAIVSFLDIASQAPRLYRAAKVILALLAAAFITVGVAGVTSLPPYLATVPWAIGILFGFVLCGYAIKARIRLAWPLFITLLVPTIAAILQAVITINSLQVEMLALQIAKLGFVVHVMMFSLCLAAHIKIETEALRVALHDRLTGLPGARLLDKHFEWALNLSRRQHWKLAVFYIDLDEFKSVNDTLGHAGGDELLVQVAARLQHMQRASDFAARLGGDEFVVLLTELEQDCSVAPLAEKMLEVLEQPYHVDGNVVRISASIGIALCPDDGAELPAVLKVADSAMYRAKDNGKNTYSRASSGLRA